MILALGCRRRSEWTSVTCGSLWPWFTGMFSQPSCSQNVKELPSSVNRDFRTMHIAFKDMVINSDTYRELHLVTLKVRPQILNVIFFFLLALWKSVNPSRQLFKNCTCVFSIATWCFSAQDNCESSCKIVSSASDQQSWFYTRKKMCLQGFGCLSFKCIKALTSCGVSKYLTVYLPSVQSKKN